MGKPTPRRECHLWEPFNHHGHAYRRGDQEVHCPGRSVPGRPWVTSSSKPSKAAERERIITAYRREQLLNPNI